MTLVASPEIVGDLMSVPKTMQAAVYRGQNDVRMESVPVPEIGPGELLIRVHTCGVCGTDLNKTECGHQRNEPGEFGPFSALQDLLKK